MDRPQSLRRILFVAGALALGIALSVAQGMQEHVGRDFHVFWQAGRNFTSGEPLYHGYPPGARVFKYPPFAAFLFQLLALFPLQVAAVLFSLLNLILWVAALYLTREIVARTFPERRTSPLLLVFAVALTAQFFLDNFHHTQLNGVILVLVLLGIRAYLRDKDLPAAAYFVTATATKITPILFVAWLMLRGRRRAVWAVAPLVIGCLLLPMVVRGPATGVADLVEYYHSFFEANEHLDVRNYNQNLAGLVYRMTQPTENVEQVSYRYLPTSQRTGQWVYRILWITVLLGFLLKLGHLRLRGAPLSAFELSLVFVTGLLLSPITLGAHFVSMILVFYTILSIPLGKLSRPGYLAAGVLGAAMVVTGLSGRDLAGRAVYLSVRGYSIYVWMLLLLFFTLIVLAGRKAPGPTDA